jgi:hypothetical protein
MVLGRMDGGLPPGMLWFKEACPDVNRISLWRAHSGPLFWKKHAVPLLTAFFCDAVGKTGPRLPLEAGARLVPIGLSGD